MAMILQTFSYPDLAIRSYVVGDPDRKECVVIDPPRIITAIETYLHIQDLKPKAILETHVHADFVSGAIELKHAFDNQPLICVSEAAGVSWIPHYADRKFNNGDTFSLGSVLLRARHTPGHTPEHISWLCYDLTKSNQHPVCAFTGDFLFVGGVGRPDLLGNTMTPVLLRELYKSLFTRISDLPDALRILPSHGEGSLCGTSIGASPTSTLGEQRRLNPALQAVPFNEWFAQMESNLPVIPRTFVRNKRINIEGPPLLNTLPEDNVKPTSQQLQQFAQNGWIFDFREPRLFGNSHAKRAINIPPSPSMGNWLAGLIPEKEPILCIIPSMDVKERMSNLIRLLGYDQPLSFTLWQGIDKEDAPSIHLETVTAIELNTERQAHPEKVYLIDVRTPAEWKAGHLEGAHHIEVLKITENLRFIPQDREVVLYCRSGSRSSIAGSLLQREGYKNIKHLSGGIQAWKDASLPTNKE